MLPACSLLPARSGQAIDMGDTPVRVHASRNVDLDGRDGGGMRVARYTTAQAVPAAQASEPLAVMARIHFPRETVFTVGDAVRHTLLRTGWRLDEITLASDARNVLSLPLPDSQRTLGPYTVRTILQVLLGGSWVWCEDPVRRTVTFALREGEGAACPVATKASPDMAAIPATSFAVQVPQAGEETPSEDTWEVQ